MAGIEEKGKPMSEPKACFVIAPIGEPESDTRKRSDQVLKHIIAPAVEACGYKAVRADQIDKPGIITSQVIQRGVGDPLVVADLSETNPNVFYELAIRHAIRKPLVQIIRKGDRIPFDVAGTRTIQVDHHDLDSVEAAKKEIRDQIKAVESDEAKMETPISVSLDLQLLRQSENPEERSLADLMAAVSDLRTGVQKIEMRLGATADVSVTSGLKEAIEEMTMRVVKELSGGMGLPRRRRRFDPFMMMKLADMTAGESGDPIGILVMLGFYRDDFPWLYEIGVVAYTRAKDGDWQAAQDTIKSLRRATELAFNGPWAEEYMGSRKDLMMVMEELPMLLDRVISRGREMQEQPKKRRGSSSTE
jgi:hypothetical protein